MDKRYILALILMALVMFSWSILFGNRLAKQRRPQTTEQPAGQPKQVPPSTSDGSTVDTNHPIEEAVALSQQTQQRTKAHVQTDTYDITFEVEPAIAQRWVLRKYLNRSGVGESSINLIPETAQNCLSLQFFHPQLQLEAMRAVWQADKTEVILTDENPQDTLTFSTQIGENLKVSKTFTFYQGSYFVDVALTYQNLSEQPLTALETMNDNRNGYKLRWGPGINADVLPHERSKGRQGVKNEGARAYTGFGKPVKDLGKSQLTDTVLWAGMHDKYFAALMIPEPALYAQYQRETLKDNGPNPTVDITAPTEAASLMLPGFALDTHQSRTDTIRVYVGPKDTAILSQIQAPVAAGKPLRLTRIIDLGFFWPLAWGMLWLLNGLHRIIPNYGISIILLTLLTKLVSYPLTVKSYKSMKEMQKLQPLLTELREKYRDDPQKLNKATMRLYKEHGVNPLGGCIPWLPQIPIFWALFSILGSAVELRSAPFFLWINDLAAPDVLITLPTTLPVIGNAIRFLPIVNGVTTWWQQKMTSGMTPTTNNMQAKMMQFLPILFIFLFYNWASGFVLYWTCNNVFTIGQQYLTQFRGSNEPEPVKALPTKKQPQPKKRKP